MKIFFLLPLLFVFTCSQGQPIKGKIENYSSGPADVMLPLFEGEAPFKVGTINPTSI